MPSLTQYIDFSTYQPEDPEPFVKEGPSRWTHVYLMRNTRNGYTKIGVSNNPEFREKTLQSEEPEVELIGSWWTYHFVEWYLHDHFADKRVRGEWFNLSLKDIAFFYQDISNAVTLGPNLRREALIARQNALMEKA